MRIVTRPVPSVPLLWPTSLSPSCCVSDVTGPVTMRMVVSPVIATGLTVFMPIDDTFKLVFIILNAMPVAANATMIAAAYNTKPDTVSLGALLTTLLSLIALPIWLWVLGIGV